MTHLKKFMFAIAAVVALVAWASTASAQVAFQMSSNIRKVRAEGTAEAVGSITLTATTAGNISNLSTIQLDFGVDIVADENINGAPDPVNVVVSSCTATPAVDPGDIDGGTLLLEFPPTACGVGDSIVISGIRVNANDAGEGATINASATATVPAGQPPITFFIVNQVPVAEVEAAFDIEIQSGRQILTCAANEAVLIGDIEDLTDEEEAELIVITIAENNNQAFSSEGDEIAYADYSGAEIDMEFTVTFKDVPEDVDLTLEAVNLDTPGGLVVDSDFDTHADGDGGNGIGNALPADHPDSGDGGDLDFTFTIVATSSTGADEEIQLIFNTSTADAIDTVGGSTTVDVGVEFAAGDLTDGEVPEFVDNEVEDPAFDVIDCQTRLEFSWVVANVSGYDTGIALANTSEDDAAFGPDDLQGAVAQDGTCTLTGYPAAGGNPVSFTTPSIAAGRTHAMVMSSTTGFSGFAGYLLVVCNFLNGHAFAFITNGLGSAGGPTLSQGYEGNVVPLGTRVLAAGESLGK
jgi:hypothetical protein